VRSFGLRECTDAETKSWEEEVPRNTSPCLQRRKAEEGEVGV